LLLGSSSDSDSYWEFELKETIKSSFFPDIDFPIEMRELVDKSALLQLLLNHMGIFLTDSFLADIDVEKSFESVSFMSDKDIQAMEPVSRIPSILTQSNIIYQWEESQFQKDEKEKQKLLLKTVDSVIVRHSTQQTNNN
jgi:hypothetical protein